MGNSVLKKLARCRKLAGRVRDMDVLVTFVSPLNGEEEKECVAELIGSLVARRQKYAKRLHVEIRQVSPVVKRSLKGVQKLVAKLARRKDERVTESWQTAAAAAAAKSALDLTLAPDLNRKTLHAFRLKIKELRNVLQLATSDNSFVAELGKVKDAIGVWHDWEDLLQFARRTLTHGADCGLIQELQRTARQRYEEALEVARTLRKEYLADRHKTSAGGEIRLPDEMVWESIASLVAPEERQDRSSVELPQSPVDFSAAALSDRSVSPPRPGLMPSSPGRSF